MKKRETDIKTKVATYDLWKSDLNVKVDLEDDKIADYYLRQTKKRIPNEPRSLKRVTTILPAIEIPDPATSYNPTFNDHQRYLNEISREEAKLEKEDDCILRQLKLAPGQTYATEEDIMKEEFSGIFDIKNSSCKEEPQDNDDVDDVTEADRITRRAVSRDDHKLASKRRKEVAAKRLKVNKRKSKELNRRQNEIFRVKKLTKDTNQELIEREAAAKLRAGGRLRKRLTTANRLGRGKFQEFEKPVTLTEDLAGSLRQIKTEGDLLVERLKSMQKRNLIPPPSGRKRKSKAKRKLKVKIVERRAHKEIKLGDKLI